MLVLRVDLIILQNVRNQLGLSATNEPCLMAQFNIDICAIPSWFQFALDY